MDPSFLKAKKFFWFDARWTCLLEVSDIINVACYVHASSSPLFSVHSKLKSCTHYLIKWNKKNFTNALTKIKQLQRLLEVSLPSKICIFLWQFLVKWLSCGDQLHARINSVDPSCLFFSCPRAVAIWIHSPLRLRYSLLNQTSIIDL